MSCSEYDESDVDDSLVDLEQFAATGIQVGTHDVYKKEYAKFQAFALSRGYNFSTGGPNLDDALVLAFMQSHLDKATKKDSAGTVVHIGSAAIAERLLCSLQNRSPNVSLPFSKALTKRWKKMHLPYVTSAMPITAEQSWSLIGRGVCSGDLRKSLIYALMWAGWLRVSEAVSLTNESLEFTSKGALVIRLTKTKTRPYDMVNAGGKDCKFVKVIRMIVDQLEKERRNTRQVRWKLFPWTTSQVRQFLKRDARELGIEPAQGTRARVSSHSFRRGGATACYLGYGVVGPSAIEAIKIRGRWRSTESILCYCRDAIALVTESKDLRAQTYLMMAADNFIISR